MDKRTMHLRKEIPQMQEKTVDNTVLKLIIVEDDPFLMSSIQFSINKLDNIETVGVFSSGREVIERATDIQADIALIDVELPDGDGFEVLNALKPSVPHLVIMSHSEEYVERAYSEMASDFIKKPFNTERLEIAIKRIRRKLHPKAAKGPREESLNHLYVRIMGSVKKIEVDELAFIQQLSNDQLRLVMSNLTELHTKGTLNELLKVAPSAALCSVHPDFLVHQSFLPKGDQSEIVIGTYTIPLKHGIQLQ